MPENRNHIIRFSTPWLLLATIWLALLFAVTVVVVDLVTGADRLAFWAVAVVCGLGWFAYVGTLNTVTVSYESVRVRKGLHVYTLELGNLEAARAVQSSSRYGATQVFYEDGSLTVFPLRLPGLTSTWSLVSPDRLLTAFTPPPDVKRPSGRDLLEAIAGLDLSPGFAGYPPVEDPDLLGRLPV